jgi:hypothetical protein
MSALGQKQTFAVHQPMSALPLKADMCGATSDVRFGPKADIEGLLNHLVSASDQRVRDAEPERLGGLQVYLQRDFSGPLDWQVAGLVALENPPSVVSG